MTDSARFRVNTPDVTHETIDGEAVIINLVTGNYYSLQHEGAHMWHLLQSHTPLALLVDEMIRCYDASKSDVERAVLQLVTELQQEQLIVSISDSNDEHVTSTAMDDWPSNNNGQRNFRTPTLHKFTDMQALLILDPIHEVNEAGWPHKKQGT